MKNLIIISFVAALLVGCAIPRDFIKVDQTQHDTIKDIYNPLVEKSFCMTADGEMYNHFTGIPWSVVMPLCDIHDIVVHTHPIIGEPGPSIFDWKVWRVYHNRFGNYLFGVYNFGELQVYRLSIETAMGPQ